MKLNDYGILINYFYIEKIANLYQKCYKTLYTYNVSVDYENEYINIDIGPLKRNYEDVTVFSFIEDVLIILFNVSAPEIKRMARSLFIHKEISIND